MPSAFLNSSRSLFYLDVSSTSLSGSLSALCMAHPALNYLDSHNANFSDVTNCLGHPSLQYLDASINNLSLPGSFPFCGLIAPLLHLDLSLNPSLLAHLPNSYFPAYCFANYSLVSVSMNSVNLGLSAADFISTLPFSITTVQIAGNSKMACKFIPDDEFMFTETSDYLLNYYALSSINIVGCSGSLSRITVYSDATFGSYLYPFFSFIQQQWIYDSDTGLDCLNSNLHRKCTLVCVV